MGEPLLRQSTASVALIRRVEQARTLWLAQWNSRWNHFHFVSGHKYPTESFRECLVRELGEELGLREQTDFVISDEAPTPIEFQEWSLSARAETRYVMELFNVALCPTPAVEAIDRDPLNRWLTEAEIRRGVSADGRPVSPTMIRLLTESGAWTGDA